MKKYRQGKYRKQFDYVDTQMTKQIPQCIV